MDISPLRFEADLLYHRHESVMPLPLMERRNRLEEILGKIGSDRFVLSNGIIGDGRRYFGEMKRMGLEGVVAKRLNSPYVPGKRPGAWLKIKHYETATCWILGYPVGADGILRSLLLGEHGGDDGEMRNVGSLELGLNHSSRVELMAELSKLKAKKQGRRIHVEPKLWCQGAGDAADACGHAADASFPWISPLCEDSEYLTRQDGEGVSG